MLKRRRIKYWSLIVLFFIPVVLYAQDKKSIQIKTFDQQLKPFPNLSISINGGEFIAINNKGIAFAQVAETELPPERIAVESDDLEAASWNYRKGVLEVTIRKKDYKLATFSIQTGRNDQPISNLPVTFYGDRSTLSVTSDASGSVEIPVALNENITENKLSIRGYRVTKVLEKSHIILVEPLLVDVPDKKPKKGRNEKDNAIASWNQLDTVTSLPSFYNIIKGYRVRDLNDVVRQQIDRKFIALLKQLEDSIGAKNQRRYISKISEMTTLNTDLQNLLNHALEESRTLDALKLEFDEKIQIITEKLKDESELPDSVRQSLLHSIDSLEAILARNQEKFMHHQESYQVVLASLRERLSDIKSLKEELSASETKRKEEQQAFQEKMFTIVFIAGGLGILTTLLLYFTRRLRKQKEALQAANDEIKNMNENLEKLVKHRTRLLENLNQEMDTFLYKASHDLRRPISSILGLSNIAKFSGSSECRELFEKTTQTANEMDRVLRKLQAVNEINHPSDYSLVSLKIQVDNIKRNFAHIINEHHVNFKTDFSNDIAFHTYPRLIEIIMTNLIENALFYSTIKKENAAEVEVSARRNDGVIEVSVYDNGVGIDPAIRDHLWDMFFVGNEKSRGNGLGLYIVYKSVDALKGTIKVDSEPYIFTRFTVTLPIQKTEGNGQAGG